MKQNKFLIGYLVVTVLGAGGLGFMVYQSYGKYAEAKDSYAAKVTELTTLQSGKPFPNEANYKKMLDLQKEHQKAIDSLQADLANSDLPMKPLRPVEFQDKLKATVDRVRQAAARQGVGLPKEKLFALDFDKYLSEPPREEAAAPLGRMLDAMEKAVMMLIATAPNEIKGVRRTPLPEEGGAAAVPAPAKGGKQGGGKEKQNAQQPLVKRVPFEVEFVAAEAKFRTFVNNVVSSKEQFYIPSAISVANELSAGPSKQSALSGAAPAPDGAAPDPAAAPAPSAEVTKFVVGKERLDVLARFDVVDFAEPAAKTADKPKKNAGK